MRTVDLLVKLQDQGFLFHIQDGALICRAPENALTDDIHRQLVAHQGEIFNLVKQAAALAGVDAGIDAVPSRAQSTFNHLSTGQLRIWLLIQFNPRAGIQNLPFALEIEGAPDVERLNTALNVVIERHEILRASFPLMVGAPTLRMSSVPYLDIEIQDLEALSVGEQHKVVGEFALAESQHLFDLQSGPLVRCTLLKLSEHRHILFLTLHHLVADRWSFDVLTRDLLDAYQRAGFGSAPAPAPPIQYPAFIKQQREWLDSLARDDQAAYWRDRLEGAPRRLHLPSRHHRPEMHAFKGLSLPIHVDATLAGQVRAFAREHHVTVESVFLAAYYALLHRYTNQNDILVGSPYRSWNPAGIEQAVGFFANILVFRCDLSGNPNFLDVVNQVTGLIRDGRAKGDFPFEKCIEELMPEPTFGVSPLFQVMFVYQEAEPLRLEVDGLKVRRLELEMGTSQYDLTLYMEDGGDYMRGRLEFSEFLDADCAGFMVTHYTQLLSSIMAHHTKPLTRMSLLSEQERQRLLTYWNDTKIPFRDEQVLIHRFEEQAKRTPNSLALIFQEEELTYQTLDLKANQLAHLLIKRGVTRERVVAVCLNPSIEAAVVTLAILKTGAAFCFLKPTYPKGRLAYILSDSHAVTLITDRRFMSNLPEAGLNAVILSDLEHQVAQQPMDCPGAVVDPAQLAYLVYTSGYSGQPKGVMISNRAICSRLSRMQEHYRLRKTDRLLQKNPLNLNGSVWEFFLPLSVGACLVIEELENLKSTAYLVKVIAEKHVTILHFIPPMLETFLQQPDIDRCRDLQKVICGGETLPLQVHKKFFECFEQTELYNLYGPIETAGGATNWDCSENWDEPEIPIGAPLANMRVYLLDQWMEPVPIGVSGEVYIGGGPLARGYYKMPDRTADKFVPDPFSGSVGARLYRTGDLARYRSDGKIEILGRVDYLIKIRGYRVELREIEEVLKEQPGINGAVAMVREDTPGDRRLVAYFTTTGGRARDISVLRICLQHRLPDYMIPTDIRQIDEIPTIEGRVNRAVLPMLNERHTEWEAAYPKSSTEIEKAIIKIWKDVLNLEKIGIHDDFFELGGNSLLLIKVYYLLPDFFKQDLTIRDLLKYRTAHAIDLYLEGGGRHAETFMDRSTYQKQLAERREQIRQTPGKNIAVIGMAGRFPGAPDIDTFWQNLRNGRNCVSTFSKDELSGVVEPSLLDDANYVPARGVLDDVQSFDAAFFSFTPREAQITDPQHRLFLECVWEAMENAGYTADKYSGDIGVFGGVGPNSYLKNNLSSNPQIWKTVGDFPITIGNAGDNLCSKVAFKMDFNGPAIGIQTACSTSLMAVHMACLSLRNDDCQIAVAGGVYLGELGRVGYLHEEGMLLSPDGKCRCFDAAAKGSVPGQGVGIVVLKPLENAVFDGDHIYAVLKGSASSNDGASKVGYTSYSVLGQSKAILRGQKAAEVSADSIELLETSSTASPLGDPIEFQSLMTSFAQTTNRRGYCALGAVKTVVGNLDVAAGITALIKTVLAVHHGEIPPNLHFENPNPKMDLGSSPFYVNTRLKKWRPKNRPRRAGVNAFGLGGTNTHVIVEERPAIRLSAKARPWELLIMSAQSSTALDHATRNLADYLKSNPNLNISDVAYTLQVGRKDFKHRRMLVCQNRHETVMDLENPSARRVLTSASKEADRPIAFMFPGQGAQYMNMGQQLYQVDMTYRAAVDKCWEIIKDQFPKLYHSWSERDRGSRTEKIHQTYLTQFSVFVVEYALAQTLIKWGIKPQAMIGNSLGEYVAACLAGVFSLEDALMVVGIRGQLMQTNMPPGEMVQVNLSETEIRSFLNERLDLAGIATPTQSMVSGHPFAVKELNAGLRARGISYRRLFSSYAFHSYMTDTILPEFTKEVSRVKLNPPKIPFISSVTGTWITDEEATDPHYWARQLRKPVRFSDGIEVLCQEPHRVFLEVGPEKTLSALTNQNPAKTHDHIVLATMRHPQEEEADLQMLLTTLGRLWLRGVHIDWNAVNSDSVRNRVPLPSYPFERKPHWISARRVGLKAVELEPDAFDSVGDELPEDSHFRPNVSTNFIEPRDAVEQTIADAWRDFLGLEEIGVHDDFFELGGSSLIAVRLINQLNKTFEVPLATHILLQKRTIATLAELIKENTVHPNKVDDSTSALVEIQHGNLNYTPLYLVHPIGGEVYFYRELAQFLGAKQPVFAFQAQSLVGKVEPYTNMEEQAAAYVEELLAVRPNPPYILGGASYGGVVAFEMARQLQARGAAVPLVVMIDSPGPDTFQENVTNDYAEILDYLVGDELQISVDELRELEPEEQLTYIFEKARIANRFDALPPALGIPMFKTWMGHQEALQNYRPTPYPGRVVFFRASERLKFNTTDMHKSWVDLVAGGIEIYQIPGNHLTMNFAPNVKIMTNHLKRVLKSL